MAETVLVVAAHPDDEVLGCGGAIARHADAGDVVHILILAEGATARSNKRDAEAQRDEIEALRDDARQASRILGAQPPKFAGLPDNRLDSLDLLDIVKIVEAAVEELQPTTVYTHHGGDLNLDHRICHHATMIACRPMPNATWAGIFEFETVSSTEWASSSTDKPFVPMRFVDISRQIDRKLEALRAYGSEVRPFPHARSVENVAALARVRGASAGMEAAEAFMVAREIVR